MISRGFAKRCPCFVGQFVKKIYEAVPVSIRLGKTFWETYNFLQESQWWSAEKLKKYQLLQLKRLLYHSYENVPYYRMIFKEKNLKPSDIKSLDDLRKLPVLDKDTFKLNFSKMMARNIDVKKLRMSHTSGTTGKPLQFYQEPFESEKEWAFICHQWSRVGYRPGEPRVELRGPIIRGKSRVYYDPITKVLRLLPYIETKEVAEYYIKIIKSFGTNFLHGYPSVIASLAYMVKRYNIAVPFKLKAVLFASENVYDWEREIVEEVFKCRVFAHYGLAEHVALAAECEYNHFYHFVPQYGITEIDPDTHEIIATGFLNYVNPFIRYKTTDIASSPVISKCENCGRNYFPIVEKIEGRLEDFIVTPQGTLIAPSAITHLFKDLKTIKENQLIQEAPDQIVLRVVPWNKNMEEALKAELYCLCQGLREILGTDMQIKIEVVDEIERLKSGKFKWIQSKVSKGLIEKGLDDY
jgi:phenylacetate-CoA ligase